MDEGTDGRMDDGTRDEKKLHDVLYYVRGSSLSLSVRLSLHVCLSLSLADLLLHLQAPSLAVSHKCK